MPVFRSVGLLLLIALVWATLSNPANAETVLRLGVLKFGTVKWEIDVLKHHQLDKKHGITLDVREFSGKNATSTALLANDVDAMVTDWLWVSRQRAAGRGLSFFPYSKATGAIMVAADSPIRSIEDLVGRKLGIAGGPLDKSWLLLRALAKNRKIGDLNNRVEKVFGAPPLLSAQLEKGRVDAVLTFWHYAARLQAKGMRKVIGVDEIMNDLGRQRVVPMIGYAVSDSWAAANAKGLKAFSDALNEARSILATSDSEWLRLRPRMKADHGKTFAALKAGFRAGIPQSWGMVDHEAAEQIFDVLAAIGGEKLVGPSQRLAPGTFASAITY